MDNQPSRFNLMLACMVAFVGCGLEGFGEGLEPIDADETGSFSQEIVGGTDTTIERFPWQVSLQALNGSHFCGGAIISADWILTAQHCIEGQLASRLRVVAGSTTRNPSASGQIRAVASIVPFPGYSSSILRNDIALLRLATPLILSTPRVKAISLVTSQDATAGLTNAGVAAIVSGWGTLSQSGGALPNVLQQVEVPLVSLENARAVYGPSTLFETQLAAGGNAGDSCQGDSGGPLIVPSEDGRYKLAGIVSFGIGCGRPGVPGIYTRVSSYEEWVVNTTLVNSGVGPEGTVAVPPSFSGVELLQENLIDAQGRWKSYRLDVPSGVSRLTVSLAGGPGDADLYVRREAVPTRSAFDCRSFRSGNSESCTLNNPTAGSWFFNVYAYRAYQGVTLTADYR